MILLLIYKSFSFISLKWYYKRVFNLDSQGRNQVVRSKDGLPIEELRAKRPSMYKSSIM
jgi:hypothetical protein